MSINQDKKVVKTKKPLPSIRCCRVCEITKDILSFSLNRNPKYPESRRHVCSNCQMYLDRSRNRINYYKKMEKLGKYRDEMASKINSDENKLVDENKSEDELIDNENC